MFRHYFEGIQGISIYPLFSLLVFFIFFVAMSVWMIKADKRHMDEMSVKPLESTQSNDHTLPI